VEPAQGLELGWQAGRACGYLVSAAGKQSSRLVKMTGECVFAEAVVPGWPGDRAVRGKPHVAQAERRPGHAIAVLP